MATGRTMTRKMPATRAAESAQSTRRESSLPNLAAANLTGRSETNARVAPTERGTTRSQATTVERARAPRKNQRTLALPSPGDVSVVVPGSVMVDSSACLAGEHLVDLSF